METTNKTKLERLNAMCEDWQIDIEKFFYISISSSQVSLQTKYDSYLVKELTKLGFKWTLELDFGFTIGTAKYEDVYIRISLT